MKKQFFLLASALVAGASMAHADDAAKVYVSVQQNETPVTAVGTAAFDLTSTPTVEFVDGKAVMKIGGNQVAVLPMSDGGQLAVEFTGTASNVTKSLPNGYATLYSPFQLQVPATSDVEVYTPDYEEAKLKFNDDAKVAAGAIIPAGTGLILKRVSSDTGTNIAFDFSAASATHTHPSALSGSALTIAKPAESGKTVYTLGHESTDVTQYAFYPYTGANMNPGLAYLLTTTLTDAKKTRYVAFSFGDDDVTGISQVSNGLSETAQTLGTSKKFMENGRVVIMKNGQKFNTAGQRMTQGAWNAHAISK